MAHDAPLLVESTDAHHLNEIVNHPAVYPWVCGDHKGPLDLTEVMQREGTRLLLADGGCFLFDRIAPSTMEVHTQFLPTARRRSTPAAREAARTVFADPDIHVILTTIPRTNLLAKALAVRVGFKLVTDAFDDDYWPIRGQLVPLDYYVLTRDSLAQKER